MSQPPPEKKFKLESPNSKFAGLFTGLNICVLEQGLGKTRCKIFQDQLQKHGAQVSKTLMFDTNYVLVAKDMKLERLLKILKCKEIPGNVLIVSVDWLRACLVSGKREDITPYKMFSNAKPSLVEEEKEVKGHKVSCSGAVPETLKIKNQIGIKVDSNQGSSSSDVSETMKIQIKNTTIVSQKVEKYDESYDELLEMKAKLAGDYASSDEEEERGSDKKQIAAVLPKTERAFNQPSGTWVCARPSSTSKGMNYNEHITKKLEVLQKTYENTKDKWRALGYKKAISSIKNHNKVLTTFEEVKNLPFVGERLAKKIWEIMETGHLRRLDHIDKRTELINKFTGVWGAGPTTAEMWVAQGYKSLEKLKENANLTFQQKIGIKHYDDFNEKMPREEVSEIEQHVRRIAEETLPGVKMEVCGSYRRGRSHCGDIDVLFSHPDDEQRKTFLMEVLEKLKEAELVTDDLICVESQEQRKYMGVCKLPRDGSKYRRIDFIVAPFNEWPLSLMHFTGSAHFNRSIRLLAKKKNSSLSEHALRENVIRIGGEKVNKGSIIPVSSEEDIFKYFGLNYLKPTDRDW